MKKQLLFIFKAKALQFFVFITLLLLYSGNSLGQTTIFSDDFNRASLSPGGSPSVSYTSTLTGIATSAPVVTTSPDYRLQIQNGTATGTAGKSLSMATMPTASYTSILSSNTGLITWAFNMRHNKSSGTTMSGFGNGQSGIATIIACDNADPTAATAKGYAVVMGGTNTLATYDLVSFSNGLSVNTNITSMITGIVLGTFKNVASIKVTYNPATNKWNMYQKDEGSAVSATAYPDPSAISVAGIGEVTDAAGHVSGALPNFGFLFSHGTTLNNATFFDNYKVTLGSASINTYYNKSNTDCSILSNWGTNTNGTGTAPTDFTAANQIFNLYNTGATIGSDWTANGSGSKVVLGDGTNANSLVISPTAFFNGKIDLAANSTLTISHVGTLPTLNLVSPTSSVIYNGGANQNIQGGSYGNLSINTTGIGTSTGAITVAGNLTISNGATLDMVANKLLGVGTVNGTGSLKTQYSSSSSATALPSNISWPFSVFYNSLTSVQSIVGGTYTDLNISGGGNRNLLATQSIIVNGNFTADKVITGSGTLTLGSSTSASFGPSTIFTINFGSTIDFAGRPVTLQSNVTGTAAIINNGTLSGATNVTVQRYLESTQRGWRMLGSPLSTAPTLTSVATNSGLNNLGYGTNSSAITYGSNANIWNSIQNATDTWAGNTALGLFVRGTGNQGMGGVYSADPSSVTIALNGTLNTTAPTAVTIDAGKWYLVANPYPAPISMASVLAANPGLQSSVAIYDPTKDASSVRVKAGGYNTIAVTASAAGAAGDVIIPVMGAVFVQARSTAVTLNIPTTAVYTGTNAGITIRALKTTSPFSIGDGSRTTSTEQTKLRMHLESNGITADEIQFVFDEQSKANSNDRFDFGKLPNTNLDFYSISSDNKNLAIDQRDLSSQSIPLGIRTDQQKHFKLVVDENTIPTNKQLLLKDNLEHISKVLVKGGTYEFDITTLNATKGNQRFELILRDDKSLVANSEDNLVRWWPNPAQEVLNIENTVNNTHDIQVEILNMFGQKMNSANITAGTTVNMGVQSWIPGLYFIQTTNGNQTSTHKVIIKALTK